MGNIKILVMDVDGTLTDGKIYMGKSGELMKAFNIKDGYAIYDILPRYGIEPVIITGRNSDIVDVRCQELGIREIYQGCIDKNGRIFEIAKRKGLEITSTGTIKGCAYIGDDKLDIPAMRVSEICGCPADAVKEVKEIAHYICRKNAGDGAVREFVEWIIECEEGDMI